MWYKHFRPNAFNCYINYFAIYDSLFSKNPVEDRCLEFEEFQEKFEIQAFDNENKVKDLYKHGKSTTWVGANKKKLGCSLWRPNAIYGNRHNGVSQDRVIMGSGLYAFDIDFDNVYDIKEHQKKLEKLKKEIIENCPTVWAVYKSFSMTGLHIISYGASVKDNASYKLEWHKHYRALKKHIKYLKVDERAKDIVRAMFIGSDSNPIFRIDTFEGYDEKRHFAIGKEGFNMVAYTGWQDRALRETYEEEGDELIERPSKVDIEFARVQCIVKASLIDNSRKRYIRHRVEYSDLDDTIKEKMTKLFSDVVKVKTGEEYQLDAYFFRNAEPIYLPKMLIPNNFIPKGRRRSTLVSLLSKFLYINGYWLTDNIPLVKTHFLKHYFEKFEQRKDAPFPIEEMNIVIDSVLKNKMLPLEIIASTKKDAKQNFNKKTVFLDNEKANLSPTQLGRLAKRIPTHQKRGMVFSTTLFGYLMYGKDLTLKQVYYHMIEQYKIIGINSLDALYSFKKQQKIDLSYLHIISLFNTNSKNIYVDNTNKDKTPPVPSKERGG